MLIFNKVGKIIRKYDTVNLKIYVFERIEGMIFVLPLYTIYYSEQPKAVYQVYLIQLNHYVNYCGQTLVKVEIDVRKFSF